MPRTYTAKSFGAILDANRGAGKGFDLLRLGLAMLILLSHTSGVTGHTGTTAWLTGLLFGTVPHAASAPEVAAAVATTVVPVKQAASGIWGQGTITGPFIRALVPMFFALSGFLVAGSALRTGSLLRFLGLRALRIIPALLVEVVLSAIILGAVFTTLPLDRYFTHPMFFSYFLNVVGDIHYLLPGVFETSLTNTVNANLWTLPYELECYLVISALIVTGIIGKRSVATMLFAVVAVASIYACIVYGYNAEFGVFKGRVLVFYFACGVMLFLWRDRIPFHPVLFAACLLTSYWLLRIPAATFITPIFLTYATVFIGLMNMPQFKLLKSGDYSYGIYLYSFPVTQAWVAVVGRDGINFLAMLLIIVVTTLAFAFLSWHGVEKHFMKLKKYISKPSARITEELHPDVATSPMSR